MRNKKGFSLISVFLGLFLVLVAVAIVINNNPDAKVQGVSSSNLSSNLTWDSDGHIEYMKNNGDGAIIQLVYGFVDFMGESAFKIAKEVLIWADGNKDNLKGINPKLILYFVIFVFAAPAIYPIIMIIALIVILIKEFIIARRERKAKGGKP